jgi:hypothetical protein
MVHITCDLCGRELRQGGDQRYVVKIEAYAVHDPAEITEADLDDDHMEAVSQLLQEEEEQEGTVELAAPYMHFRYDLCPDCHQKFVRDPLAREMLAQKLDFSKN